MIQIKYLDIGQEKNTKGEHVGIRKLTDFINDNLALIEQENLTIRLSLMKTRSGMRQKKEEAENMLNALLREDKRKNIWKSENGVYIFDFKKRIFKWQDDELYITAGEALALFKKIVLGVNDDTWGYYFSKMKKKFSDSFLKGIV